MLSNISYWIFNNISTHLRERVQPLTVPALLEHEAISGLDGHSKSYMKKVDSNMSYNDTQQKHNKLLQELVTVKEQFQYHGIDSEIIAQIYKQLFYFICASALNNLLLRNDLCHWSKGMQIR